MADPITAQVAILAVSTALNATRKIESPRPQVQKVTLAAYGTPYTYGYGKPPPTNCICVWAEEIRAEESTNKTKGGKYNEWTFFGTAFFQIVDQPIAAVTRVWLDEHLVIDYTSVGPISSELAAAADFIRIYLGEPDAEPDARMAATIDAEFGAGSTRAFRDEAGIGYVDLPLEKLGNHNPQVKVEYVTVADPVYPIETLTCGGDAALINGFGLTWSHDRLRFYLGHDEFTNVWDQRARALMVAGELAGGSFGDDDFEPAGNQRTFGLADRAGYFHYIGEGPAGRVLLRTGLEAVGGGEVITINDEEALLPAAERSLCLLQGSDDQPELQREVVTVFSGSYVSGAWQVTYTPGVIPHVVPIASDWKPRSAFRTVGGAIKLIGGGTASGVYAANQCVISGGIVIDMPEDAVGLPPFGYTAPSVAGFHYKDEIADIDQYVIGWKGVTKDWLVIYDLATDAIIHQHDDVVLDPYYMWAAFESIIPGSRSIWLYDEERSAVDGSLIRSYGDITDWGVPLPGNQPGIYNKELHALLVETGSTGGDFVWLYLDRVSSDGTTLQTIVEDIGERCGLVAGTDFDASALGGVLVKGFAWTQQAGKSVLGPLLEAFDVEARPHNFGLQFIERGGAVQGTIPVGQMGAGGALRYTATEIGDGDLTKFVDLIFADPAMDGQPNTAGDQRGAAAADTQRTLTLDVTLLVMSADEARGKAIGYQRRTWFSNIPVETALTRGYSGIEPGDVWTFDLDGRDLTAKVTSLEKGADGVLRIRAERDQPSVHAASALGGAEGEGFEPPVVLIPSYTKGVTLDIPLVVDADDAATPFAYLAASPYSDDVVWPGALFYRSDDAVDYDVELGAVEADQAATIGYALSALPDALSTVWDEAGVVTIKLFSGALTSASKAAVANGANTAALKSVDLDGAETWELIRFRTATLVAVDTYQLSGLQRGRRGTEQATGGHAAGDTFVLLSGLPRAVLGASDVGETIYVRPTTNGGPNGFPQTLAPYTGAPLLPYAPAHLAVAEDGGDLVATWTRRTRIGGNWSDFQDVPLGEASEAYVGQVLDAGGAVIRTLPTVTSPTVTYTAAQQATDGGAGVTLRVCQVSAVVGNGRFARVAI